MILTRSSLRTGRRPVSSQETSCQCSGARSHSDGGPHGLPPGCKGGSPPPECSQGGGVTGDDNLQGPGGRHPSAETGNENQVLDDGAAVDSQRDRVGSTGMA